MTATLRKPSTIVAVAAFAAFLATFNETFLNVAFAPIMANLGVDVSTVQWLATAYMLGAAVMVPVSAFAYRSVPTRPLFVGTVALLVIGSVIGALAPSFPVLLAGRIVQALGTGLLIPIGMNITLEVAPREKLGTYMGIMGAMTTLGPSLSVIVAGVLLAAFSWHMLMAVFAVLMRLRQICCDPRLVADNWSGGSAKLDACMELVTAAVEGGHRILLFSQFTSMLDLLAQRLDEAGVSHFTLQGSTPKPVRAELVRRFNAGEASVFLISLRAGGTGLNLTAADIVIHYDPWWNVAAQNQATDRAYRIGQKNPVQVYKLIAQDTIEEKIVELQQAKQSLADTVTGSADGTILSMKPEELLQLLGEEA